MKTLKEVDMIHTLKAIGLKIFKIFHQAVWSQYDSQASVAKSSGIA